MKVWVLAAGLILAASLSGCATQLGDHNIPLGTFGSTEIDGVNGTYTQYDQNKKVLSKTDFDPESKVEIPMIVYGNTKNRLFEWCPILGVDVCDGEGSFFCGARYFEIAHIGLHFGGDRNNFVPFGIDYEKAGVIVGVQIEHNWLSLLSGNVRNLGLGLMATLKL